MLTKIVLSALVLTCVLSGCSRAVEQPAVYPGVDWTQASSPESLGWSSDKLVVARASCRGRPLRHRDVQGHRQALDDLLRGVHPVSALWGPACDTRAG